MARRRMQAVDAVRAAVDRSEGRGAGQRIMGGLFALEIDACPTPAPSLRDDDLALSNARSGLYLLLRKIPLGRVWLPSYVCPALISAVRAARRRWEFYPIDASLGCASREWMAELNPEDAVVLIDYFGFPTAREIVRHLRGSGVWLIRDACQALYASFSAAEADFVLYSPRKFAGIPDGGIVAARSARALAMEINRTQLTKPPAEWTFRCFRSSLLRREFDLGRPGREWFDQFRANEASAPIGAHSMGELSLSILRHGLDHLRIAERRRANYAFLAARLGSVALRAELPDAVVPLGFPIRASNRDDLRKALFREGIYPPVHWALDGKVRHDFDDAYALAAQELTLPCDQRYGEGEMQRMAELVAEQIQP